MDPASVPFNRPQQGGGTAVMSTDYNCFYLPDRKPRMVLGFIAGFFFIVSFFLFIFATYTSGLMFFLVFLAILAVIVYNFWRLRNEAMQRGGAQMMYNQGPTQPVPGQSQQPTYPQYPYPQYPAQSYPTQPPYAMSYPPQSYPPNTTAPQAVSGQASSIQDAQPQIQSMATVPSAPSAPAGSSAEPPPPSYDEVVRDNQKQH